MTYPASRRLKIVRIQGVQAIPEQVAKPMTVAVAYRFSRRSFVRATHAAWRSQLVFQALALMMVLLLAASAVVVVLGAGVADQIPVFAYGVLALAFYVLYPNLAFAFNPKHRLELAFEFSRDGFRYRRGEAESALEWPELKGVLESGDFYILDLPGKQKVALPKSAFGPGEEQRFRLLAATSGVQVH